MKKISLIALFLSFIINISAQKYYFDSYGIKQNLSNSDVYVISQSKDGYIWLGTKSGISNFDGLNFNNFYSNESIAANGMKAISHDSIGGIWFGHIGGGLTYYINGKFYDRSIETLTTDITSLVEDKKGRLWISTYGDGVYRINNPYSDNLSFEIDHYTGAQGLSDRVSGIYSTNSFGLLFITDYGVKYWNDKEESFGFIKKQILDWPEYFPVITIYEDSKETLWVGTYNGGLYQFKNKAKSLKVIDQRDGLSKNWVSYIYEDDSGIIWVGTWGGGVTTINNGVFKTFDKTNGLDASKIRGIYQDYEGNVLIASKNKGVFIYKGDAFLHYNKFFNDKPVQINSIYQYENESWFGSESGIWMTNFDDNSNKKRPVNFNEKTEEFLLSNSIRYVECDKSGDVWIGTWGGGVSTYNRKKNKIEYNFIVNRYVTEASNGNVSAMTIDNKNNLFIGAAEGLIYYEIDNSKIDFLTQTNGLAGNDITALYTSKNGTVWIGSRGKGLTTIKGSEIIALNLDISFTPTCFTEANDGAIWIGTEGRGVIVVKNDTIIKTYTATNGVSSGLVTALIADDIGNVFIGTPKGVFEYRSEIDRIIFYGKKEGFVGVEVRPNAVFKNSDGEIFFGTSSGLTLMNSKNLRFNTNPPKTNITQVRVDLIERDFHQDIEFDYSYSSLLINYKALCISDADKVRYKVMLDGADKSWQPETEQAIANYPSLSPGNYTFKVIAMNNSGVWNEKPASFTFVIHPPFWKTFWFYGIVLGSIIVLLILFVKVRERTLMNEKAALESKVEKRTVEISEKNRLLAKKNKDITDSINYAKRIQSALMPPLEKISADLPHSFVFYKPKDIVSGDFYWFAKENNRVLLAAADCTGHGVPGAFMSMISISSLNKIVKENNLTTPGVVLNELRADVVDYMAQGKGGEWDSKDGLDISLLNIDVENRLLEYAGAYNSLYIVKDKDIDEKDLDYDFKYSLYRNRLIEIKADRMPIGISEKMDKKFHTRKIDLEKGDLLIISTDGYIDQFGGERGRKLMSRKFKDILIDLPGNSPIEMQSVLDKHFHDWLGDYEQIDDVLVVGVGF